MIVADGFSGYNVLEDNVTRAGCWSYMRRYWYDAFPKDYKKSDTKREKLDESVAENNVREPIQVTAFKYCNALFELEREFENLDPEERRQQRQFRSKPVVEKYYQLVDSIQNPGGELKSAVTYATNQRSYLCAFLEDGNIEISNNAAEISIRNCVIGRKNWLFCDTPAGARASAAAYSVMATAKLNGLNVYNYVCYLLETLSQTPDDKRDETIASLMPWLPEMQAKFRLEKADTNQN